MLSDPSTASRGLRLTRPKFIHCHPWIRDAVPNSTNQTLTTENQTTKTYNGIPLQKLEGLQHLSDGEIRLSDLYLGEPGTPLFGTLRKVKLSGPHEYEPLFYTWEDHQTDISRQDESDIHPVFFEHRNDDLPCDWYMDLQTNCARALYHMRKEARVSKPRTLWVDAICIN